MWIWGPWVVALSPSFSGLLFYSNPPISQQSLAYIAACLVSANVAYILSSPRRARPREEYAALVVSIYRSARLITNLAFVGLVGSALFAIEMVILVGVNFGDLFALRGIYAGRDVTLLSQLAPMLIWCSWISLVAAILAWQVLPPSSRRIWVASPAATAVLSVLSAGRQAVFQLLVILVLCLAYRFAAAGTARAWLEVLFARYRKVGLAVKLLLASGAAGIVIYMGVVAVLRNDSTNEILKSQYLFQVFGAAPDPDAYSALSILPFNAGEVFWEGLIYFSSGVALFSGFFDISVGEHYLGQFTFPWVARRFEFLSSNTVVEAMQARRDLMIAKGFMSHGWSTALASYILDFGVFGAVLLFFVFGWLAGLALRRFGRSPNIFSFCLVLAANVNFIYMIMVPATSDSVFFFFVLGCIILMQYVRTHDQRFR